MTNHGEESHAGTSIDIMVMFQHYVQVVVHVNSYE